MTGGTRERCHSRVVHGRTRERGEIRGRVASLAWRAGYRYVRGGSARGLDTVVAGGAPGGNTSMIENSAGPTDGRMTGIALQVGIDVLRALALGLHIVVTG